MDAFPGWFSQDHSCFSRWTLPFPLKKAGQFLSRRKIRTRLAEMFCGKKAIKTDSLFKIVLHASLFFENFFHQFDIVAIHFYQIHAARYLSSV